VQVTAYELDKQREADERAARIAAAQRDQAQRREVGEDDYEKLVLTHNDNAVDAIDARDVDSALAQISVGEECALLLCTMHPINARAVGMCCIAMCSTVKAATVILEALPEHCQYMRR
jgi:hypothetical protein